MKNMFIPISLMAVIIVNVSVIGLTKVITAGEASPKAIYATNGLSVQKNFYTPKDIIHYLNTNTLRLSKPEVDRYLLQLIALQKNHQKSYERKIFSDTLNTDLNKYNYQDLVALRNIKNKDIKNLLQNIYADGFKLSTSEGMVYIEIDYPKLREEFGRFASPEVDGYFRIRAVETARHFSEDAGLMISVDSLGNRIAAIEAYCKQYPRFSRINELKQSNKMYLQAYLIGMNNTPAFSYKTNQLDEEFLKSYSNSIKLYKRTAFARLVQDYLKILEKNHYNKTQAVLEFVRKVVA